MQSSYRIIMAGGGTGGHIFPAIAIAHALKRLKPDIAIQFVGAKGKMEMEKVPQAGYPVEGLEIAGLDRGAVWKNLKLPLKLLKSLRQAGSILRRFQPDAVVGTGGYASFPMLHLAQRKGIPTVIQEQNSYAGKSNKILGRKADRICVAYDGMERFFPPRKIVYTGNPVRENISRAPADREEALQRWGLSPDRKTIFAVGGSLGALSVNESLTAGLQQFAGRNLQLIWQTGKPFYPRALEAAKPYGSLVKVTEFVQEMELAYAAADVVISRAGALAISELCVVGKPVVFVPYPYAAEDHQLRNALALADKEAALVVRDADARRDLLNTAFGLLENEKMQEQLIRNIGGLGIRDADERIAKEILSLLGKHE